MRRRAQLPEEIRLPHELTFFHDRDNRSLSWPRSGRPDRRAWPHPVITRWSGSAVGSAQ